jgi:spoIIIJ-associated protein
MEEYLQEIIANFLTAADIEFGHIGIQTQTRDNQEEYLVDIDCQNAGKVIGKNGENIGHINHLIKLMVKKRFGKMLHIKIDIDNYIGRQKEKSIGIAEKYIEKLKTTGKSQSLPPMSPMLRATVHTYISDNYPNIETESKGFGKYRYITINVK